MAAVFKKYKVKKLLLGIALYNASATPALVVGEDYVAAGETIQYMQTKNAELNYEVEQLERELDDATLGFKPKLLVGGHFNISSEIEFSGSGTAATAPAYSPLLKVSAMAEDSSSGTHVDYTQLDDDSWPDGTIYFYMDGVLHKALNAHASISYSLASGALPTYKFDIKGIYGGVVGAVTLPTPTFTQLQPARVSKQFTTFKLDSVEYAMTNYTYDHNSEVTYTDIPGYEGVSIDDFSPEGEIEILCPALADFDPFAIVRSEAESFLALEIVHGTTAGNIITISNTEIQILGVGYGEYEGKRTYKMPYGCIGPNKIRTA